MLSRNLVSRPQPRLVLFDFDYTLADSSSAVVECCNVGLRGIGLPPAEPDAIRRTIGLPIPDTLATLAGEEHRHRSEEFRLHWRLRSEEIMIDQTHVYAETAQAVEQLRSSGIKLGIVSTKWRIRIVEVLKREGLDEEFAVIVGGDEVTEHKPDPEGLRSAMAQMSAAPDATVYVGDTTIDAQAAANAETSFVGVLSGMTPKEDFEPFRKLDVVAHVGEAGRLLAAR